MPEEIDRVPPNRVLGQRLLTRRRFLTLTGAGLATYGLLLPELADAKKKKKHHKKHKAKPTPTATTAPPTLQSLGKLHNFLMGSSLGFFSDPQMAELLSTQFDLGVVPEVDWAAMEPVRGQVTINGSSATRMLYLDDDVQFGEQYGMRLRGMHLLWQPWFPAWLINGTFSATDLRSIIQDHVTTVVTYFKGKLSEWTVVNEYFNGLDQNPLAQVLGDSYIDLAFQTARQADPSATLLYNDNDNHLEGSINTLKSLQIVNRLKPQGLIDGIGMQMHLDAAQPPDKDEVVRVMQSYGVPIYVTEFDVTLANVQGTQDQLFALQAQIYSDMLSAAFESGVCHSFTMFTPVDKYSWLELDNTAPGYSPTSDPTAWDSNFQPKPAYYALMNVLQNPPAVVQPPPPAPTLRDAASKIGVGIGTYLGTPTPADWTQAIALQEQQCNLAGIPLWWNGTEPTQGNLDLGAATNTILYASLGNMAMIGLPVVAAYPDWLQNGSFTSDQLSAILASRIESVLGATSSQVGTYVLVSGAWSGDLFWKGIGASYLQMAFGLARSKYPGTKLLYGAYDAYTSGGTGTTGTQQLVQQLKQESLIDGVALSMQLDATSPPDRNDMLQTFQSYGVPVYVVDLDVNLRNVTGSQSDRFASQAQIYQDVVYAALASGVCKNILFWSLTDKTSTEEAVPSLPGYSPNANPDLFDDNFQPKPAFDAVLSLFQNPPPVQS